LRPIGSELEGKKDLAIARQEIVNEGVEFSIEDLIAEEMSDYVTNSGYISHGDYTYSVKVEV